MEFLTYWTFSGLVINYISLICQGVRRKPDSTDLIKSVDWGEFWTASVVIGPFALLLLIWCLLRDK